MLDFKHRKDCTEVPFWPAGGIYVPGHINVHPASLLRVPRAIPISFGNLGFVKCGLHISTNAQPCARSGTPVMPHLMLFTKSWIPGNWGGIWEGKRACSSSFADLLTKFHSSGLGVVGTPCVGGSQSARGMRQGPALANSPFAENWWSKVAWGICMNRRKDSQ